MARSVSAAGTSSMAVAPPLWQSEVLQLIDDAVVAIDSDQRITFWNAAAEKLYGVPKERALGKPLIELYQLLWVTPEEEQRAAAALSEHGTWRGENMHVRRDGNRIFVSSRLNRIPQKEGGGMIAIMHDLTETKRLEEALSVARGELERDVQTLEQRISERTAKLHQTIADLEAFSYSVSHDLRAPVRILQSLGRLLQKDCSGQMGERGAEYVDGILATAGRMDRLIQDILTLSRVARADFKLEPVAIERLMHSIIDSTVAFQQPQAEIEIRGPLPVVLGNETALTQCFSNLLSNAVKFVRPDTLPRVQVFAQERGEYVRLWFCDNGIGIAPKYHARLFGIFQRLASDYEGTGIGLAIVKKAAERMSGRVGVESELGKGSRFWLELKPAR